jgi:hypothetical protein
VPRTLFGDITESVGERFDGEVLMVRTYRLFRSAAVRWVHKWFTTRSSSVDGGESDSDEDDGKGGNGDGGVDG